MYTKSILVCDDSAAQRMILGVCLSKRGGYNILDAVDGDVGLSLYRQYKPSLVITDLWMPYLSGEGLAKAIRETDEKTPILLITGSPEDIKRPKLFTAIIEKPVAFCEVYAALDRFRM